jgi:hypothetical protein
MKMVDAATGGSAAYAIPDQVYLREVNGQMVLLNLETEQYYGLDEVGAVIVNRLIELPRDAAVAAMLADFEGVDTETLGTDVDTLVASLITAGLLEENSAR